ncbi:DUF488 domain-containing protein [Shigella flexneri]
MKKTDLALDEWDKRNHAVNGNCAKPFTAKSSILEPFGEQYLAELAQHVQEESCGGHRQKTAAHPAYAAKNTTQNHALVLAHWLRSL